MATNATQLLMDQLRMQQALSRAARPQTSGFSQALSYSSAIGRSYEAAATNLVRGVTATGARDIDAVRKAIITVGEYAAKSPVTHRKGIQELQSVLKTKENQLLRDSEAVDEMELTLRGKYERTGLQVTRQEQAIQTIFDCDNQNAERYELDSRHPTRGYQYYQDSQARIGSYFLNEYWCDLFPKENS